MLKLPSSNSEDDKVSKLNDLNEMPVKENTGLREETVIFPANLTDMLSEIESPRKMTEEWKEAGKGFRKELGRKDDGYQAAIQLLEAKERFNSEISAKEDECKAVNVDKNNLEATVLHLKNQIQVRSPEFEATSKGLKLENDVLLSQFEFVAAKKATAEIPRSSQMAQQDWNAEKENLLSRHAELQTNFELIASEKGSPSETNRELRTKAECLEAQLNEYNEKMVSIEDERQMFKVVSVSYAERLEALLKQNATMVKEISSLQQRVDENVKVIQQYKAEENSLKQQNQMLHKEVHSTKRLLEKEKKRVNGKRSNQLVEELTKKIVDLQEIHVNVMQEKDEQMKEFESLHAEALKKYKVMEEKHSELLKGKEAWNAEKENLLSRLTELQTNLELMVSEKGSLSETNRELRTEAVFLNAHLNDCSEKLVSMEDERQALEAVSVSKAERLEALLEQNARMEKEISSLQQQVDGNVKQHSLVIQQCKVEENSLKQQNEMLEREVGSTRCLLEVRDKSIHKRIAENGKLSSQVEELSTKIIELEKTNVNVVQEKDELKREFESLHAESVKKHKVMEEKHSEFFKEKEAWNAEKENLLSRLTELQTNLELMVSVKGSLSETNRELRTEAESLKAHLNEYSEKLVSMEDERQALEAVSVSKAERLEALLEQNARMEKEISSLQQQVDENVKQHSLVIQQYKVEENSLKQQNEMLEREVGSTRCLLEVRDKSIHKRIAENGKLSSQVEELSKKNIELEETNVNVVQEKDELKREFESLHAESVKKHKVMEEKHSELFKEKEAWNVEKENLLSRLTELQTNLELMVSEKVSLSETNRELRTEAESLKAHLNECSEKLVSMEDERKALKAMPVSKAERLEALLKQNATMEKEISSLQHEVNEHVKQHSLVIQQYKVEENSLKQQNEMLEKEVRDTRCLLEIRDKSIHKGIVENGKLSNQVEDLSKKIVELQETNVNVVQEKDELNRGFESLHAESLKKYKEMAEKHSELFKEKKEQAKTINSLRREINSLTIEKSLLSRNLKEATKKYDSLADIRLQSQPSTIAQEERSELVDIVNHMVVHEKPKPSNLNGKQCQ